MNRVVSSPGASATLRRAVLPSPINGLEVVLLAVLAALWIALGIFTPAFLTMGSIRPLLVAAAPVALMGIGMTFIIITAGIDVSISGALMLCAVITAKTLVAFGIPLAAAIALSVGVGLLLGLVNGLLIAYGNVHPIIITFGTANIFEYAALRVFHSSTVNGIPSTLNVFGLGPAGRPLGLPTSFLVTAVAVVAAWWFLRHTVLGRHLFAIGDNAQAARLAGIRVRPLVTATYALTGALLGLGACFLVASGTSTLDQTVGSGQVLLVIAATVIGGTSILGGRGSVIGTLLGAILVQTVESGVTQLGWPSALANLFVGLAIVVAVGTDLLRERIRRTA